MWRPHPSLCLSLSLCQVTVEFIIIIIIIIIIYYYIYYYKKLSTKLLWMRQWTNGFAKMRVISSVADELPASRDSLCSTKKN